MAEGKSEFWNGVGVVLVWGLIFTGWDTVKGWFFPAHPAPVSIEAHGKD
jgi:hypothetical protein